MLPYRAKGTLQMWLIILRWGDYPELSGWAQYNRKGSFKGKKEKTQRWGKRWDERRHKEKEMWQTEREVEAMLGRGHDSRNTDMEQARKTDFPWEPPKTMQLCRHLFFFFSLVDPFKISDPQEYELIHLHCFKPLSLWWFVTASIGKQLQ